ncbi:MULTISPECIES: AfsR/SARP family transcriptional regulator [Mycobacteroides]|uniref:Bacterial transcriptional activator domain-containing protein n=1 Tax=Mycobacteroides immunogenum TaxID=83262 RepID=A0A179VE84_9MYCO|nr:MULTISPECIES: hypothetical protein [Mycobacteroides]OAT69323.1 hypothetical protein AWB85_21400 [Mycobacteroides immunogenum]SKT85323.1 DNA-binding transcriptional activator of the SARP family [Mycobacteroides abscessus subsp. massiliense]SKU05417.1 DNA-binding transcriptional activator of the SARP family [Mycobacteroides abscessus subsp. massiliense]
MSAPTITDPTVCTTWWYGKGNAVTATRLLEQITTLSPPPGPAGIITIEPGWLRVAFTERLARPLPPPWQSGSQVASVAWDDVTSVAEPHPGRPVALVILGVDTNDCLITLNLAAFARIQFTGDAPTIAALANRWILELIATHPTTKIGVTEDLWPGPFTTRVHPVTAASTPEVDILVVGSGLSYADRARIFSTTSATVLLDLGDDAANSAIWTIDCPADRCGQITNGDKKIEVTLHIPQARSLAQGRELLVTNRGSVPVTNSTAVSSRIGAGIETDDTQVLDDRNHVEPGDVTETVSGPERHDPTESIDYFSPTHPSSGDVTDPWADLPAAPASVRPEQQPASAPAADVTETVSGPASLPAGTQVDTASDTTEAKVASPDPEPPRPRDDLQHPVEVRLPVIWNRILGPIEMFPPNGATPPSDRIKICNEILVLLQTHRALTTEELRTHIWGGAVSPATIKQRVSTLRTALGDQTPGVPYVPHMDSDGEYSIPAAVKSDWMIFEDLVGMIADRADTARLVAAMNLVIGPPFGGVKPTEWKWAAHLREQVRNGVSDAAKALAERHLTAGDHTASLQVARKGLWYDVSRQDVWKLAIKAARAGGDTDAILELRRLYQSVPDADRDAAVANLIERG